MKDPDRIVWCACRRAASDGELWELLHRDGRVETRVYLPGEERPKARPLWCFPFFHTYRLMHGWLAQVNESYTGPGELKPYLCTRCGKSHLQMPAGVL